MDFELAAALCFFSVGCQFRFGQSGKVKVIRSIINIKKALPYYVSHIDWQQSETKQYEEKSAAHLTLASC